MGHRIPRSPRNVRASTATRGTARFPAAWETAARATLPAMTFSIVARSGPDGRALGRRRRLEVPRRRHRPSRPPWPGSAPSPPRPRPTSPTRAWPCPTSTRAPPPRSRCSGCSRRTTAATHRQVGIVDVDGNAATYTGERVPRLGRRRHRPPGSRSRATSWPARRWSRRCSGLGRRQGRAACAQRLLAALARGRRGRRRPARPAVGGAARGPRGRRVRRQRRRRRRPPRRRPPRPGAPSSTGCSTSTTST